MGLSAGKIDDTIFLIGKKVHWRNLKFIQENPYLATFPSFIPILGGYSKPRNGRIQRFNSGTEKWEEVGSFQRSSFAMQAGF